MNGKSMTLYTTDTLCAMTGVLPATLRSWRRAGLVPHAANGEGFYSSQTFARVRYVLDLTNTGDTLPEIHRLLNAPHRYRRSGWQCRTEEVLMQLGCSSTAALNRLLRTLGTHYSGEAFVNCLLRPLNLWLRSDNSAGAVFRLARFHAAVLHHAGRVMALSERQKSVPIFLETASTTNETEIWLEAIRLTGQGCRVEISPNVTQVPAEPTRKYEHHLVWCGAGISRDMKQYFKRKLDQDYPVMLCGTDTQECPPS